MKGNRENCGTFIHPDGSGIKRFCSSPLYGTWKTLAFLCSSSSLPVRRALAMEGGDQNRLTLFDPRKDLAGLVVRAQLNLFREVRRYLCFVVENSCYFPDCY